MSCHSSSPRSSAASYSSGRETWACTRSRSSPASSAHPTSARSSSGDASARAIRVGPWLAPLRKSRSPFTEQVQWRSRTDRSPVRNLRTSLVIPAAERVAGATDSAAGISTATVTSWRTGSPSARGHHSSGRSAVTAHSSSLTPAASGWVSSWSSAPSSVRTHTVRRASLSSVARKATTARSGVASRHSTRRRAIRTGPVSVSRTGRQMPPGFQAGSRQSQCWKTPVRLRLAVLARSGAHVASTANTCSSRSLSCSVISNVWGTK